jgi:hypothetical protein
METKNKNNLRNRNVRCLCVLWRGIMHRKRNWSILEGVAPYASGRWYQREFVIFGETEGGEIAF